MTPDTLNSLKELTLSFFFFSVLACTCSSLFNDLSLRSRDPFRPLRCTRSPNGIAKVLLFFYSANFFRIFLKFSLSPLHITPPGPPEADPGPSRHRSRTGSPNKKRAGTTSVARPKTNFKSIKLCNVLLHHSTCRCCRSRHRFRNVNDSTFCSQEHSSH